MRDDIKGSDTHTGQVMPLMAAGFQERGDGSK